MKSIDQIIKEVFSNPEIIKLRDKIRQESNTPDFDWIHGGCFGVVRALQKFYKGEVWVVASFDEQSNDWATEHALYKIGDKLYDAEGEITEEHALNKYSHGIKKIGPQKGWKDIWFPNDYFMNDEDVNILLAEIKVSHMRPEEP